MGIRYFFLCVVWTTAVSGAKQLRFQNGLVWTGPNITVPSTEECIIWRCLSQEDLTC